MKTHIENSELYEGTLKKTGKSSELSISLKLVSLKMLRYSRYNQKNIVDLSLKIYIIERSHKTRPSRVLRFHRQVDSV